MFKNDNLHLSNSDATEFIKTIPDSTLQCIICDPPFGLDEDQFEKHYARNKDNVIDGYQTAPKDDKLYENWLKTWIHQIPRVLKPDGTLYIVCAWNHVCDVELAIRSAPNPGLSVVNHIIWKYNFGVYTQKKFVSSHYHIIRCAVGTNIPLFNSRAYFSETDKTGDGHSAQYSDMEDVWFIPKEYKQGESKNINKLPDALVKKMILYSSNPGDWVADFFLGNFTTAYNAIKEGRKFMGCEINEKIYNEHADNISNVPFADSVTQIKASTKPKNSGKKISEEDTKNICSRYDELHINNTKKQSIATLQIEFERGYFSILNILKNNNR